MEIAMKMISHAWVALMALERLKTSKSGGGLDGKPKSFYLGDCFCPYYKAQAARFVEFFDKHKDAFVQGAWFPDSVIADNLAGGHTFKMKKPSSRKERDEAVRIKNRTPGHLGARRKFIEDGRLEEHVYIKGNYVLPDRCEALSHAIRDMMLIQKEAKKGSDIIFNDDQITLYFLMLSHYMADAHVPPHSDSRDFYTPPTIHPDMEEYWECEIKKFYSFDDKRKVFDYDIGGAPELNPKRKKSFDKSFLKRALEILGRRAWDPSAKKELYLGKNNRKIYDYAKAVCFDSYLLSTWFIPELPEKEYTKVKILKEKKYRKKLREMSPYILADAIDSIALTWVLTWDKYSKLKKEIRKKTMEIKSMGGTIAGGKK
jgi:hypothetical protein